MGKVVGRVQKHLGQQQYDEIPGWHTALLNE